MTEFFFFTIALTYAISDLLRTSKQKADYIKQQIGQKIGKMLGTCLFFISFTAFMNTSQLTSQVTKLQL